MKIGKLFSVMVLGAFLMLGACSPDEDLDPEDSKSRVFVAKVDGDQFPTDDTKARATYIATTKMLQIIGQNSDQTQTIVFQLMPFAKMPITSAADWVPGTYSFNPVNVTNSLFLASGIYTLHDGKEYINFGSKWGVSPVGEIVISENTGTHIKGTFKFDAVNNNNDKEIKRITEGSFDLDIH
jgi:hypothetical protein